MNKDTHLMNKVHMWGRIIFWAAVSWLFIVGLIVLNFWPYLPKSKTQWFLLIAIGPPLYVFTREGSGWLFSRRHGYAISQRSFSVARILVALFMFLAVYAFVWWVLWLFDWI